MNSDTIYRALIISIFTSAALSFILLVFIKAPYGRYMRQGWGPSISARKAWIVMEAPAVIIIIVLFITSEQRSLPPFIFLLLWQVHYMYRTFLYPLLMKGGTKAFPILLVLIALFFNSANGYVNGWSLFHRGILYEMSWFADPRFITGIALFIAGLIIHIHSDRTLRLLRRQTERGYKIPMGGMYRFVSAPNYLGEIVQWCGWALATWSTAGLAFAVFTIANLLPRGISHHRWYNDTFQNYPKERKAVIPLVL
ncbi:MAG: DUF1295 domain-containing protein [Spirochaetales bacterium]|jgi:3-oxo-5-alpha-steroid 4-dehydrogenase 1|nr:DUF1295 domain-containing protein [Spirochaetales bacterium]